MNFVRTAALLVCASRMFAQFGGPALLTRGQAPSAMSAGQIDFTPFVGINANYSSGLGGVTVNAVGEPVTDSSFGVNANAGITGTHLWKHTRVGLSYTVGGFHYGNASFFDGISQSLSLAVNHTLTRHTVLAINVASGLSSQNNAAPTLQETVPYDPNTLYRPTNDFFTNRTVYLSSGAYLSIQRSTRLSFSIGADESLTRYRSNALYGETGGGARGDVHYRISRRSTIGVGYNYNHFVYTGVASNTDAHSVVGTYGITLVRNLELSAYAGVTHYESKFVQVVPLDPAVAALLGITSASRILYNTGTTPNFSVRLSRIVRKGSLSAFGTRSITPGNGVFLTSISSTYGLAYSYAGLRRWSIGSSASYSHSSSVGNVIGTYDNFGASLFVSRHLVRFTNGVLSATMNHAGSIDFSNYNRWQYTVNLGLNFTPGDLPVRFW